MDSVTKYGLDRDVRKASSFDDELGDDMDGLFIRWEGEMIYKG